MYNIKQAAARAGVSVPVLRAWERRYGIVHPERTASGYRQFDEAAVERIKAMRALIAQGWSPSAAAAAIVAGTVAETTGPDQPPIVPVEPISLDAAEQLAERLVSAAAAMAPSEVDQVLDDLFSRGSFERVATDLLFPALRRLGDAWAAGQVNVAGEHLASSAVQRRLGLALDAAASVENPSGGVIVGLPPGGRHELGALAFAVAARRAGLAVSYLGPDLPVEDWVAAAADASAAVIGVVTARDRSAALDVARGLRAADRNLVIALGGRAVPSAPEELGATRLPDGLREAVGALATAVAQERGRADS
jgi:DNA-binding transcriptional MerR regulator/methylmalonyl-CoA mutase cobalamin-binding subunit